MQVLLIRFSSMGDVVLASAVVSWFSRHQPDADITLCTRKDYILFFENDARIRTVVAYEEILLSENTAKLRDIAWDQIIDLQNNHASNRLCKTLTCTGHISRFDKLHWLRFCLLYVRLDFYKSAPNVLQRYGAAANIPTQAVLQPTIYLDTSEHLPGIFTHWHVASNPLLVLIPFTAWKNKEWPLEYFASVGKTFADKGYQIALLGSKCEQDKALQLARLIGSACKSFAGELSLMQCAKLMATATIGLGGDTGLVHLGRAVGLRCGVVYGSTTRHFGFFPTGLPEGAIFETPLICRPCHPHGGDFCIRLKRPCLGKISPQIVTEGLVALAALR